ncbi:MAG: rhodanese-like domain-containing protein [Gemmatimonadaceae bacterium]|nr:rhodanese-like domain-containing protein [Gemmatimonadaceae bacterium]
MYFSRMKRENRRGPRVLGAVPTPPRLAVDTFVQAGTSGNAVIVDTRARAPFLARHVRGSLLAERAFQFVNITGSYIAEDAPIYLVIPEAELDAAVRDSVRIGLDDVRGWVTPEEYEAWLATSPDVATIASITMEDVESRRLDGGYTILDVRGKVDFVVQHIPGAINAANTALGRAPR